MSEVRPYLVYLTNRATGNCYYEDATGHINQASVKSGIDVSLQRLPDGWMDMQVSFARNTRYQGINRSFTDPFKFLGDGAKIIRSLLYSPTGRGTETPVGLVILKHNTAKGTYQLFYEGNLDLPKTDDSVMDRITVPVMEGGVIALLKAFENTVFEFPCDGSIPENIKILFDGLLFEDSLYYNFINFTAADGGVISMPAVFVDNDGDNIGIQHGDPVYESQVRLNNPNYFSQSANYLFSSLSPITIRIKGSITVRPVNSNHPSVFNLYTATSKSVPIPSTGRQTNTTSLVPGGGDGPIFPQSVIVTQQTTYAFDQFITLDANENLFLMFENLGDSHANVTVVGGSFQILVNSMYPATSVWAMTLNDLWKLMIKAICKDASNTFQTFNYGFVSQLLSNNLNICVTSGDALRASGDPNYNKFYNSLQNNPNYPNINQYYSYGPVIKMTPADLFDSSNVTLNGALGNQKVNGQDVIFFEAKSYVYNPTTDPSQLVQLGEVTDLKISIANDNLFNLLKLGYQPQQYDQKGGKYETNTTGQWQAPVKAISKTLELVSKVRTDPYGMERLRSNVNSTSSTNNNSDNSAFFVNVDFSSFIYDSWMASFVSAIPNTAIVNNTNLLLVQNYGQQALSLPTLTGGYFRQFIDASIFVFNQVSLSSSSKPCNLSFAGTLTGDIANLTTGLPADTVTIKLFYNGTVLNTWVTTVTGITNPFSISYNFTQSFTYKDCLYVSVSTSSGGTAVISSCQLQIGAAGAYYQASMAGLLTVQPGTGQQLIPMGLPSGPQVNAEYQLTTNYQYFVFNDIVINSNFNVAFAIQGLINGLTTQHASADLFVNGTVIDTITWPGTIGQTAIAGNFSFNRSFQLGDIMMISVSATSLQAWITQASLTATSTFIKAYYLFREKYDRLSGVPNLTSDTTQPGALYNIFFSPGRTLRRWGNYLRSALYNLIPGNLLFHTLDKNKYLSTTIGGVTITENADIDISTLDMPLFYPFIFSFKTKVGQTFAQNQAYAANGHAVAQCNTKNIYGFPVEESQKPVLDEPETWKMLCSPLTNLADLIDLNIDGINFLQMAIYNIAASLLNPVKFVPATPPTDPRYPNINMDADLFVNRISDYTDNTNYALTWLQSHSINMQFISNSLAPMILTIYDCNDVLKYTFTCTNVSSNGVLMPYLLYQISIPASSLAQGFYYFKVTAGSGINIASMRSEPIRIVSSWPVRLLFFDYSSSFNTLSTLFDTIPAFTLPVEGWIGDFSPGSVYSSYADQQQDFVVIKGVPYRKYKLNLGVTKGMPDYTIDLLNRIMILDTVLINGVQYARAASDSQFEAQRTPGQPKDLWSMEIREAISRDALTVGIDGGFNNQVIVVATIDAAAFGQNQTGEDLISVNLNA